MSKSTPTIAICPICRGLYQMFRPRNPQNASMNTPAIRKRTPHISAGGMRSTAISIAKYVDPQKKYTSPKARITAKRLWRWTLVMKVFRSTDKYQTHEAQSEMRDFSKLLYDLPDPRDNQVRRSVDSQSESHHGDTNAMEMSIVPIFSFIFLLVYFAGSVPRAAGKNLAQKSRSDSGEYGLPRRSSHPSVSSFVLLASKPVM